MLAASSNRPGRRSGNRPAKIALRVPPLFGLAPGGVCHAVRVAASAVVSYTTVSPLPAWFARGCPRARPALAVFLCCTVPGLAPAGRYPAPLSPWSPDFPRDARSTPRSSGRLAGRICARSARAVNPRDGAWAWLWVWRWRISLWRRGARPWPRRCESKTRYSLNAYSRRRPRADRPVQQALRRG